MPRYIDAEPYKDCRIVLHKDDAGVAVKDIPTADVAPVRHAHWVRTRLCNECSLCRGGWIGLPETKFCPSCSAIMDEEVE